MTKNELIALAKEFDQIKVGNYTHVIRPIERAGTAYPQPNYLDTGMAFVGELRMLETFSQFKERWVHIQLKTARDYESKV